MRRMAFASLSDRILDRSKTVTRRRGWQFLVPGDHVAAVVSSYQVGPPLALLRVESVRRERLRAITPADIIAEGFAGMAHAEFLAMFAATFGSGPDDMVTRIEFSYAHAALALEGCHP